MNISMNEMYDIIHNKDPNEVLETSCLDYANQNNDEGTAQEVLKFEHFVHMQDRVSVVQCIRESLKNDELKIRIKKLYQGKKYKTCLPQCKRKKQSKSNVGQVGTKDKRCQPTAIASIFIQIILISILPYSMDEVSDIRLYLNYSAKSIKNQTSQEYTTDHNMHNEYNIAKQITGTILIINCCVYIFGIILSQPTWITRHINKITKKVNRKEGLENTKKDFGGILEIDQKELDTLLKETPSKQWKIFLIFLSVIARIFWPLFILIPHNYLNKTSTVKSDKSKDKYHTENIWMSLKVVESSIENVTQLFLQIWLLLPYFRMISMWSWEELRMAAWNGSLNILTFGLLDQPKELDITIGKIFTTIIFLSLSHAMLHVKKPGIGIGETMKLLLIMFPATLLQVTARMYMVRNLMLMNITGAVKYSLFIVVHCLALLIMKIIFETRRKPKMTKITKKYTVKRIQSTLKGFKAYPGNRL